VVLNFAEFEFFRVDRVTVLPHIFIISDWRNDLVDNSRFIRIYGE
jgi:hypothetical protein